MKNEYYYDHKNIYKYLKKKHCDIKLKSDTSQDNLKRMLMKYEMEQLKVIKRKLDIQISKLKSFNEQNTLNSIIGSIISSSVSFIILFITLLLTAFFNYPNLIINNLNIKDKIDSEVLSKIFEMQLDFTVDIVFFVLIVLIALFVICIIIIFASDKYNANKLVKMIVYKKIVDECIYEKQNHNNL